MFDFIDLTDFGLDEQTFFVFSHLAAGLCMGLGAIGPAFGVGYAGHAGVGSMARQPKSAPQLLRLMLIGQAITETSGIFALLMGILLLFAPAPADPNWSTFLAMIGSGLAMGLGALGCGIGIGITAGRGCEAAARQPQHSSATIREMLIGQAISETPAIFSLVIAMLLFFGAPHSEGDTFLEAMPVAIAMLAAGLCMGMAAIGSGAGSGMVSADAVDSINRFRPSGGPVFRLMIIAQGISQSPAVYGLVVSLVLIFSAGPSETPLIHACALMGAACAAGLGAVGSAFGIGIAGGRACAGVARKVQSYGVTFRAMLIGMAVAESPAIFGLIVAFLLLFQ